MKRSMGMQVRLPTDRFMGLRQTISEWVRTIKDALDLGPEFPTALEGRRVMFAHEAARLQYLLEQTRKAAQEKDELIAKLRTAGAVTGNMIVDGPAYYVKKANTLDGPFCTCCFQRHHEISRLASAPKPKGANGTPADWVQCGRCKTPFRSERISQYLNASIGAKPENQGRNTEDGRQKTDDRGQRTELEARPASAVQPLSCAQEPKPTLVQALVSPERDAAPEPVKTARKPSRNPNARSQRGETGSSTARPAAQQPSELEEVRLEKAPAGAAEPQKQSPAAKDSGLQVPSVRRTRARTRKAKGEQSE